MKQETPNPVHRYIGKRLYELRMERGVPLEQLAATIRVTPAHLHAIESGTRRLPQSQMFRIAEALTIAPEQTYVGLAQTIPLQALIQHTQYIQTVYATFKRRSKWDDIIRKKFTH